MKNSLLTILAAALMVLGGCTGKSAPAKFYQITPSQEPVSQVVFDGENPVPVIGVGPVILPAYLDRPQIVTRSGENRLNLAEFDKWAEPLEDTVSRLILSGLTQKLNDRKIALVHWKQKPASAGQIAVTILRMDNSDLGEAVLVARWTLRDAREGMVLSHISSHREQMEAGGGPAALVRGQGMNIDALCREIAEAIEARTL